MEEFLVGTFIRRPFALLLLLIAGVPALAVTHHAAAAEPSPSIADVALGHLDTHGGQCWTFVQAVVFEATGAQIGNDYRQGFFEAGAVEVQASEAARGDIIQVANDADTSPWASYPGLHTAIVLENLGGGRFNAIDSNQDWDEWVRLRPGYDPYATAARNGLQVHIYRMPRGAGAGASGSDIKAGPATVNSGSGCLNLRAAAGLAGARIGCLPEGTSVTVTGDAVTKDGFDWVPVETPAGKGWMAARYLKQAAPVAVAAAAPSATAAAAPAPAPVPADALPQAHVDDSPGCLRLRDVPGTGGAIVACLGAGVVVSVLEDAPVTADGYEWVHVKAEAGTGWVAGSFLVR